MQVVPAVISLLSRGRGGVRRFRRVQTGSRRLLRRVGRFVGERGSMLSGVVGSCKALRSMTGRVSAVAERRLTMLAVGRGSVISGVTRVPSRIVMGRRCNVSLGSAPLVVIVVTLSAVVSLNLNILCRGGGRLSSEGSCRVHCQVVRLRLPRMASRVSSARSLGPGGFRGLIVGERRRGGLLGDVSRGHRRVGGLGDPRWQLNSLTG